MLKTRYIHRTSFKSEVQTFSKMFRPEVEIQLLAPYLLCSTAENNNKFLFDFTNDFDFCIVFTDQWYFESGLDFYSIHFYFWNLQLILN